MSVLDDFFSELQSEIEEAVTDCKEEVLFPAVVSLAGNMKQRIHNEGLDSGGNRLGSARGNTNYSPAYAKYKKKFRNFSRIDLSLRDNLETALKAGVLNDNAGISLIDKGTGATNNPPDNSGITNKEKAFFLEEMFKTTIYEPTDDEEKTFFEEVDFLLSQKLQDKLRQIRSTISVISDS